MHGRTMAWWGGAVLLAAVAGAQETGTNAKPVKTVARSDVKSWTTTIEGREWSVRPAALTYDGDTGLFRLGSAYTLPKGKVAFALFRNNLDRDPQGVDFSVHGLGVAFGATSRLELFASGGIQNRAKVNYPGELGYPNDYPFIGPESWDTGFGDLKVGLKYAFLNDYAGDGVGLAVRLLAQLPTADETKGLGTGKTSFLGDLVVSKSLGQAADLHASIGYEKNGDPDDADLADALRWGVGLIVPACHRFQLQAEVTGKAYGDSSPAQTDVVDLVVGPAIWLGSGWFVRPSWSYAINYDGRGRDVSFAKRSGRQIEIGYHPGTPCCLVEPPPPPPPPPPSNRPPTVSLDCLRDSLLAGETTPCNASAADPDGDRLSYAWSASAGRANGTGASITLETAGVACATGITVKVTVSDGRGGTASATDTVRIVCPQAPKAEPVTCVSSGFPRNMSRLNNVDKACLDDVAARLRQDPRSRVVIVGHADARERRPEVLGRSRAEAAKVYLVRERGIEEARITARSAPAAAGYPSGDRARNSRVEVTFVPEGASLPGGD